MKPNLDDPYIMKQIRQERIFDEIIKRKSIASTALAAIVNASISTVRRDLIEMEKNGLITRIYGGATTVSTTSSEPSQAMREGEQIDKKKLIAEIAANLLRNNQSVFLDSSTTNRCLIPHLNNMRNMLIVTNSLKSAIQLSRDEDRNKVMLAGGWVNESTNSTYGEHTCAFLDSFHPDIAFLSVRGLSAECGASVVSTEQQMIKRTMIQNAAVNVLLCDSTKFDTKYVCQVGDFCDFTYIISDCAPPESLAVAAAKRKCRWLYPA